MIYKHKDENNHMIIRLDKTYWTDISGNLITFQLLDLDTWDMYERLS